MNDLNELCASYIYILLKIGFSLRDIMSEDWEFLIPFTDKHQDEKKIEDMFQIRLHGGDPMESDVYKEFIRKKDLKQRKKLVHLDPEDAQVYRSLFDSALKEMKRA